MLSLPPWEDYPAEDAPARNDRMRRRSAWAVRLGSETGRKQLRQLVHATYVDRWDKAFVQHLLDNYAASGLVGGVGGVLVNPRR